jgi:dipeptidyl aminopeptidase/acylaminoacyl peptidase
MLLYRYRTLLCLLAVLILEGILVGRFLLTKSMPSPGASPTLENELKRNGVSSALVVPTADFCDMPRWSPSGKAIAFTMKPGKWWVVDLTNVEIERSHWRADKVPVGRLQSEKSFREVKAQEIQDWKPFSEQNLRSVTLKNGTTFRLDFAGFGRSFVVQSLTRPAHILWTSGMEDCFLLAPSPDQKYVAFVAMQNGIVVVDPELVWVEVWNQTEWWERWRL